MSKEKPPVASVDIKALADGNVKGQLITCIVETEANIIPTVVLNIYGNLGFHFIYMYQGMKKTSNLVGGQPIATMNYIFQCTKETFEPIFGKYAPNKILQFRLPENPKGATP